MSEEKKNTAVTKKETLTALRNPGELYVIMSGATKQPFVVCDPVTFDDELVVHNIRLVEVDGKIMLSMPNKKIRDGVYKDYVHPINNEFRDRITDEVISRYYNT